MIAKATELFNHLFLLGFKVEKYQEEDPEKAQDAEVILKNHVVIQIGYGKEIEYGLTMEPNRQKRANSGFRHIGYYTELESLLKDLRKVCEQNPMGSWRSIIRAMAEMHGEFDLDMLYKALENHPKAQGTRTYKDKIRQILGDRKTFVNVGPGRYALLSHVEKMLEARRPDHERSEAIFGNYATA